MAKIETYAAKAVLTDNDLFVIADSAAANATKKATRAAILTDATELVFTIVATPRAKVTAAGLLVDSITELTAAGIVITATALTINTSGDMALNVGNDFDENVSGVVTVAGNATYTGTVAGAAGLSVVNGRIMA